MSAERGAPLFPGIPQLLKGDNRVFQNETASAVPFTVKSVAGQTASVFKIVDSSDTTLFAVDNSGNLTIAGTVTISVSEVITGSLTLNGNLNVSGTSTLTGAVSMGSTLDVTGQSTFHGATFNGIVNFNSGVVFNGSLTLSGSLTLGTPLALTSGGTNASLTASNGGIVYSTASAFAILSGTATANQMLLSGSSTSPIWSTVTMPTTVAAGSILAANSANVLSAVNSTVGLKVLKNDTGTTSWNATTGTGDSVMATSPTLVTPALGAATATTINGLTITSTSGGTLTLANSSSLITSGGNSITLTSSGATNVTLPTSGTLATLAGSETLSSKTLTAPKFADAGFIADANGNELIIFTTTASAVNEWTFANGATGVNPKLTASGETNVGLDFQTKGTGVYRFLGTSDQSAEIRIYEDTDGGTNYTAFKVPALAGDVTYTLPNAVGGANTVLTDAAGNGTLSWATGGSSAMTLLKAGSGTTSNASAENLDSVAITGLTEKDTLIVWTSLEPITDGVLNNALLLYNDTDAVSLANASGNMTAGSSYMKRWDVRQAQSANTKILSEILTNTGTATVSTFTTAWTGSWTLALRQTGMTGGGSLDWSWAVYKIAGQ